MIGTAGSICGAAEMAKARPGKFILPLPTGCYAMRLSNGFKKQVDKLIITDTIPLPAENKHQDHSASYSPPGEAIKPYTAMNQ
jgi:phosphoribosylpyrophosphate synthetase